MKTLALILLLALAGCASGPDLNKEYQDWPLKPYPVAKQ